MGNATYRFKIDDSKFCPVVVNVGKLQHQEHEIGVSFLFLIDHFDLAES